MSRMSDAHAAEAECARLRRTAQYWGSGQTEGGDRLAADLRSAADAIEALAAQRDTLLAAMKTIEWSARGESGRARCPYCHGAKRGAGHDATCIILTAIRAAEGRDV